MLSPRPVHPEKGDQLRPQQYPTGAESDLLNITQFGKERFDLFWKKIVVVWVPLEPQVDQHLRDMPDGVVECLGDRLIRWPA
ncbi:hypothetical protein, partial [Thiolapillus sp.]